MRLPFEPGEYPGVLDLPDGAAQSAFQFRPNRPPTFEVYEDHAEPMAWLPKQAVHHQRLIGRLRTNHDLVLGDAYLEEWSVGQHSGSARWALVGLEVARHLVWQRLRVHISGLEALLHRPVNEHYWPSDGRSDRQTYSAVLAPYPVAESIHGGVRVHPHFNTSSTIDPYEHRVTTYAATTFHADQPLDVDSWLQEWAQPLATLVSIATGRREQLRLVTTQNEQTNTVGRLDRVQGVLFASGINQELEPAERQLDDAGRPLVPLFTLAESPPLATMVAKWRSVAQDLPALPLLRLSQNPDLHPGVRFLLLAHAAESLHRATVAAEEPAAYKRRKDRYKEVLAAIKSAGLTDEHQFLREIAEPRRPYPLFERLQDLLSATALSRHLDAWDTRTADLDVEVRQHERTSRCLGERLAHARNILSHGAGQISPRALKPAVTLLDIVVRLAILNRLGFTTEQVNAAVEHLTKV